MMDTATLDRVFSALADPGRRRMVERLCRHPASVKELAEPAGMGLPSALKHLRVLEEGGIVVSTKAGRVRTYAIHPTAFGAIERWVREREAVLHAAFDRLERAMLEFPEEGQDP
jgi:DNA-binding transcriptional ArsR family regulator